LSPDRVFAKADLKKLAFFVGFGAKEGVFKKFFQKM
jgi:hypothetical protein